MTDGPLFQFNIKSARPTPGRDTSFVGNKPVRAFLINNEVENDETGLPRAMQFFINPDQLTYKTAAEWARIAVPGLSHEVLQYSHAKSDEVSFDLEWSALEAKRRIASPTADTTESETVRKFRRQSRDLAFLYRDFLRALTIPMERGRAPSRVTLVWPGFLHMTAAVTGVDFSFTQWSQFGEPMAFVAGVDMVELRTSFRRRRGPVRFFDNPDAEENDSDFSVEFPRGV